MKRWHNSILALAMVLPLALTGCKNNNLFGGLHREGSGDAVSLLADGETALATGNFAAALDYFSRALAANPNNADALYGAAVAEMGLSGLDIGQLVSNLLTQNSFSPALHQAYTGHAAPGAIHVTNNSLLEGIDIDRLDDALGAVIPRLEKIRMGQANGDIAPNDSNLLINLGLVRLLRAASHSIRTNQVDILVSGSDYTVQPTTGTFNCAIVDNAGKNVGWAYQYLTQAALGLQQTSGDLIFDLKEDIESAFPQIEAQTGCVQPISAAAVPSAASPTDGLNP